MMMITHNELEQFIRLLSRIKELEEKYQRAIDLILHKEGLTLKQCLVIAQSSSYHQANSTDSKLDKNQQKVKKILLKIRQILQAEQYEKQTLIKEQGFDIGRFNQIVQYSLQNPTIQQEIQQYQEPKLQLYPV